MRKTVDVRASKLLKMLKTEKAKIDEVDQFLKCLINVIEYVEKSGKDPVLFTIPKSKADLDKGGNPDPCCGWC